MLHPLAASWTTLTAAAAIDVKDLQMSEDERPTMIDPSAAACGVTSADATRPLVDRLGAIPCPEPFATGNQELP